MVIVTIDKLKNAHKKTASRWRQALPQIINFSKTGDAIKKKAAEQPSNVDILTAF
jgi:hypothetical protein